MITYNGKILKKTYNGQPNWVKYKQPMRLIYSDTSENMASGSVAYTYDIDISGFRYNLFQISERIYTRSGACDLWLQFNGVTGTWAPHSANAWRFRSHNNWRNYHPIRCCQLKTDPNPVDWCNDFTSAVGTMSPQDNETCYYSLYTTPRSDSYLKHSFIIDNTAGTAKHYAGTNYDCTGNLVTGGMFTGIAKVQETGMYYIYKDIYIYGSNDESELTAIIQNGN